MIHTVLNYIKLKVKRAEEGKKRIAAMQMIGNAVYENLFDSIEGEDLENR